MCHICLKDNQVKLQRQHVIYHPRPRAVYMHKATSVYRQEHRGNMINKVKTKNPNEQISSWITLPILCTHVCLWVCVLWVHGWTCVRSVTIYLTKVISPVSALQSCSLCSKFSFVFGYVSASGSKMLQKQLISQMQTWHKNQQFNVKGNILLKYTGNFHNSNKME